MILSGAVNCPWKVNGEKMIPGRAPSECVSMGSITCLCGRQGAAHAAGQLASRPRCPALHEAFPPPGWLRAVLALQLLLLPFVGGMCSLHSVAPVSRAPQASHPEACPGPNS
ncbi:unnamed protein product [Rangifer tarandus platyrhynchus]|uniref:Uncharacterized protein n=1 Tax=Rangifer tarandus platyrhynchus TaxID=3082113 RepID=A0AC59ZUW1_RANTA